MISRAKLNGLPRPVFESAIASFKVTMSRSELLGPEVKAWLAALNVALPTPVHEIAMAMMRDSYVTNSALREWGTDRASAGQVLRELVDDGVAIRSGDKGRHHRKRAGSSHRSAA